MVCWVMLQKGRMYFESILKLVSMQLTSAIQDLDLKHQFEQIVIFFNFKSSCAFLIVACKVFFQKF